MSTLAAANGKKSKVPYVPLHNVSPPAISADRSAGKTEPESALTPYGTVTAAAEIEVAASVLRIIPESDRIKSENAIYETYLTANIRATSPPILQYGLTFAAYSTETADAERSSNAPYEYETHISHTENTAKSAVVIINAETIFARKVTPRPFFAVFMIG